MSKHKLRWNVDSGYVNSEPDRIIEIDAEEFQCCTLSEINSQLDEIAAEEFQQQILCTLPNLDEIAQAIFYEVGEIDDE